MSRKKKHPEHVNHERWLISYADFITLLFAFFVVMFAVSQVDTKKVGRFTESFSQAIGMVVTPSGAGLLPAEGSQPATPEGKKRGQKAQNDELSQLEGTLAKKAKEVGSLHGLKVVRRGNELVLRMDATVLFESGEDRLKDLGHPAVIAIANEIRNRPVMLRIEGHTDNIPMTNGRFRSNWDLSTSRATSVIQAFAEVGKVDPTRLAAVGYAEFHPIAENDTPEGRAQNRRVDFVISMKPEEEAEEVPADGEATPAAPAGAAATAKKAG